MFCGREVWIYLGISMFFVSLAANDYSHKLASDGLHTFCYGNLTATVLTEGWASSLEDSPDGFRVVESLPKSADSMKPPDPLVEFRYDARRGQATLTQNPAFGRSVYYHLNAEGEFFCSTHLSILRKASVPLEENVAALPEFFIYRYVMPPETMYKGIHRLPLGGRLHIDVSTGGCRITHVCRYTPQAESDGLGAGSDLAGKVAVIKASLQQSINDLGLYADSALFLLSGGLDSSILYRLVEKTIGSMATHSTGYSFVYGENDPEKDYAVSSACALGARHRHHLVSREEYLYGFLDAIAAAEEPLHHLQSVLIHVLLGKAASRDRKIVICGQGADGIFGLDFHERVFRRRTWWDTWLASRPVRRFIDFTYLLTGSGARYVSYTNPHHVLWSLGRYGSRRWVHKNLKASDEEIVRNRCRVLRDSPSASITDAATIVDLLGDVSITQSIWAKLGEARRLVFHFPYCSQSVMDGALAIEWQTKLSEPKCILRTIARQLDVPEFIITRPKAGFGLDHRHWAGAGGFLQPFLKMAAGTIDEDSITDACSQDYSDAMTLWNIANYAIWKRLCIRGEPLQDLKDELRELLRHERRSGNCG